MPEPPSPQEKRSHSAGEAPDETRATGDEKAEADRAKQAQAQAQAQELGLWRLAGLGTELTGTVIVFVAVGWFLDSRFGWTPWGMLSFGLLGVAAGMYRFIKEALR